MVALLTEGVDRNLQELFAVLVFGPSPSSRRAWIEISTAIYGKYLTSVALLTEGVDRNRPACLRRHFEMRRPPHGGRG